MASVAGIRIQQMVTTTRQMSFRIKQRAQQTRRKMERFVDGEAEAVTLFLGIRPSVNLVPTIPALAFIKSAAKQQIDANP